MLPISKINNRNKKIMLPADHITTYDEHGVMHHFKVKPMPEDIEVIEVLTGTPMITKQRFLIRKPYDKSLIIESEFTI